jgi:hypothetical protein
MVTLGPTGDIASQPGNFPPTIAIDALLSTGAQAGPGIDAAFTLRGFA